MKNIVLIIFTILLAGCVADRHGEPVLNSEKVLNCPEIVEAAAENLGKLDINQLTVQVWKESVLSKKLQPCNACQKLNAALYVLNDENGIYKPAMIQFINNVENDPNAEATLNKPYVNDTSVDETKMKKYSLAEQYLKAIEDLQTFLSAELRMPIIESKNFVLDNYFIPFLQENEAIQDVNQP